MYYNWEEKRSNDPEWEYGEKNKIIDAKTGEEIVRVLWCDTEVGVLCRCLIKDGRIYVHPINGEISRVTEFGDFKIVFPNRKVEETK